MLAILIDSEGQFLKRLSDIPVPARAEEERFDCWTFEVRSLDGKPGAYGRVTVELRNYIASGNTYRCLAFLDETDHSRIVESWETWRNVWIH